MEIRKFQIDMDLDSLETYLRDQYIINKKYDLLASGKTP